MHHNMADTIAILHRHNISSGTAQHLIMQADANTVSGLAGGIRLRRLDTAMTERRYEIMKLL
jgi:hypothetical protein